MRFMNSMSYGGDRVYGANRMAESYKEIWDGCFLFGKTWENGLLGTKSENISGVWREFTELKGEYPAGCDMEWENMASMRKRILPVLEKYKHHQKIIVACHGVFIQSLCNGYDAANGEIVAFEL